MLHLGCSFSLQDQNTKQEKSVSLFDSRVLCLIRVVWPCLYTPDAALPVLHGGVCLAIISPDIWAHLLTSTNCCILGMFELKLHSVALSVRQFCSQAQLTYSCWITASRCGRLLQYNDETFSNTRRCRKTRQAQQNIPSCLCLCCLVSLPCRGEYCQHCTAVPYPHSMLCNPAKASNTAKTPPSRVRIMSDTPIPRQAQKMHIVLHQPERHTSTATNIHVMLGVFQLQALTGCMQWWTSCSL